MSRYVATCASSKTDDWPFWYIADTEKGGLNVFPTLYKKITGKETTGLFFASESDAKKFIEIVNKEINYE